MPRKYAVMFPVQARTESVFSKDDIETAAKISLVQALPIGCELAPEPEWDITWAEEKYASGNYPHARAIRIAAQVTL